MKQGILVMAYGTPQSLEDVESYYTDIRHGRPPSPEMVADLVERYRAIGGHSPLREITEAQAGAISRLTDVPAYVGYKHAAPFIPDAVARAVADGVERLVGLVLAPHYSKMSIGDYAARARRAAADLGWAGRLEVIPQWHLEPRFVEWLGARVLEAIDDLPVHARSNVQVVFTAHSLPERIRQAGDPYPDQLAATASAVTEQAGLPRSRIGWQSAGRTADPWIGPDILDILEEEAAAGTDAVVVCPCGFVADHLEVLYDVDIEAKQRAVQLGMELRRTRSPNADPAFLDVLAGVVVRELATEV